MVRLEGLRRILVNRADPLPHAGFHDQVKVPSMNAMRAGTRGLAGALRRVTTFAKRRSCHAGAMGALSILSGCAVQTNVVPEKYDFPESAETVVISSGTAGQTRYRVFCRDAQESIASLRAEAERQANEFCDRKGKVTNPLELTTYRPPVTRDGREQKYFFEHLMEFIGYLHPYGGRPDVQSVEIFFECLDAPDPAAVGPPAQRSL
jgi:hypothetical protein